MKRYLCLLILTIFFLAMPALADSNEQGQGTDVTVTGDDNEVNVDNTQITNKVKVSVSETTNNQMFVMSTGTKHHLLDLGLAPSNVMSISMKRPLVLPININNQTVSGYFDAGPDGKIKLIRSDSKFYQYRIGDTSDFRLLKPGEMWSITWYASAPVYVYAIHGFDRDRVASVDGIPMGEPIRQTFDHQNVAVVHGSDSMQRSRKGEVSLTVEEFESMAFVIDPRVTNQDNGIQAMYTAGYDTVELTFEIQRTGYEKPETSSRKIIGERSTYPIDGNGKAVTV